MKINTLSLVALSLVGCPAVAFSAQSYNPDLKVSINVSPSRDYVGIDDDENLPLHAELAPTAAVKGVFKWEVVSGDVSLSPVTSDSTDSSHDSTVTLTKSPSSDGTGKVKVKWTSSDEQKAKSVDWVDYDFNIKKWKRPADPTLKGEPKFVMATAAAPNPSADSDDYGLEYQSSDDISAAKYKTKVEVTSHVTTYAYAHAPLFGYNSRAAASCFARAHVNGNNHDASVGVSTSVSWVTSPFDVSTPYGAFTPSIAVVISSSKTNDPNDDVRYIELDGTHTKKTNLTATRAGYAAAGGSAATEGSGTADFVCGADVHVSSTYQSADLIKWEAAK